MSTDDGTPSEQDALPAPAPRHIGPDRPRVKLYNRWKRKENGVSVTIPLAWLQAGGISGGHIVDISAYTETPEGSYAPGEEVLWVRLQRVTPKTKMRPKAPPKPPANVVPLYSEDRPLSPAPPSPRPSSPRPPVESPNKARASMPPGTPANDPAIEMARIAAWRAGDEAYKAWRVERHHEKEALREAQALARDEAREKMVEARANAVREKERKAREKAEAIRAREKIAKEKREEVWRDRLYPMTIIAVWDGAMHQPRLGDLAEAYEDIHLLLSGMLWPQETEPLAINNIRLVVPGSPPDSAPGRRLP